MTTQVEVLQRDIDWSALRASAHEAIAKQKRGMVRGAIGMSVLVAVCVALFIYSGQPQILAIGFAMLCLGANAISSDLLRLALTRKWGREPPLDVTRVKTTRTKAILTFLGALALWIVSMFAPAPARTVFLAIAVAAMVYEALVIRETTREIEALRD